MLDSFFISETPDTALHGIYTPALILLSYVVASFASYTGLALAGEVAKAQTRKLRSFLFLVGAFAMGGGIWSMHFIGMLAFHMDNMPMSYDPMETALSMMIAVTIAFGVFRMTQVSTLTLRHIITGALLLGTAICGMHYTGMAAMRMDFVTLRYLPSLFFLSVGIAVTASGAALWIFFHLNRLEEGIRKTLLRCLAGLVMGAAICGMHYTGMLAAVFIPSPEMCLTSPLLTSESQGTMAFWIAGITSLILATALSLTLFGHEKLFQSSVKGHNAFPIKLLAASMFLTAASLIWTGGNGYFAHKSIATIMDHDIAAGDLAEQIIYLDDTRTENLQRAVETGDASRRAKYDANIIALNAAIAVVGTRFRDTHGVDSVSGLAEANRSLLTIEQKVLKSWRQGSKARASALLEGSLYQKGKALFADNANDLARDSSKASRQKLVAFSNDLFFTLLFFVVSLPVQAVIWAFTLISLRHWRRELVSARATAESASRSKGDFLANMSHELRTPMNGIIGLTQLLSDGEKLPEQGQLIEAVKKSSESLLYLLNDILDFSKIEAGQLILEETPFSLRDSLKNVIDLLSVVASKKGLVLNYKFTNDAPSCVVGDALRINQIATNLIGNAIKFTSEGHVDLSVSAELSEDGQHWIYFLTVSDTGIGIPLDKRDNLFKKFSQVDTSTTRKYGGTGLGLTIAKMLSEKMQGRISLESMPDVGTIFTATMVLKAASESEIVQTEKRKTPSFGMGEDFAQYKVLLVDDHPVNRLFAQKLLNKMGFRYVDEAVNGLEALEKIQSAERPYDIVLMDCQMPEMDGLEAVRRIRVLEQAADTKRVPVVAMTAHAMQGDRNECIEAGMDDYISKPVNPDKLRNSLHRLLCNSAGDNAKMTPSGVRAAPIVGERPALTVVPSAKEIVPAVSPVIELEHLQLFTEGDAEMEGIMAHAFLSAGKETLDELKAHLEGKKSDNDWRMAAHKLKGSAAQIGAVGLSKICLVAESGFTATADAKLSMLRDIEHGFEEVDDFFSARLPKLQELMA